MRLAEAQPLPPGTGPQAAPACGRARECRRRIQADTAGRFRSPTPTTSKAWRRSLARPTRSDAEVLARLSRRDLVPAIWLPDPETSSARELARFSLHLIKHRSSLENRIHAPLIDFGKPCPVSDVFSVSGRQLLAELDAPERWRQTIEASLRVIDHSTKRSQASTSSCGARAPRTATSPSCGPCPSAERRSPRSTSRAGSRLRSGTCSPATDPSLRQAPAFVWRPRPPFSELRRRGELQ